MCMERWRSTSRKNEGLHLVAVTFVRQVFDVQIAEQLLGLSIGLAAMPNFDHIDDGKLIVDRIRDSIVALTNAVALFP